MKLIRSIGKKINAGALVVSGFFLLWLVVVLFLSFLMRPA